MNIAIVCGNVGQDPRITDFENGGKVAQFSLATTEKGFKTQDGREIPDRTDWHNIVVRRTGLAGIVEKFVKKGTPLLVQGKMQTREFTDDNGIKHFITEIIVDELKLLGSKEGSKGGFTPAPAPEPEQRASGQSQGSNDFPENW